jgi:hypothetical protein
MSLAAYSIHIGINHVDPEHYMGWSGPLKCCENDALYYYSLAKNAGFKQSVLLLTSNKDSSLMPTSENLIRLLNNYSETLVEDDFLLISYSGHGGTMEDQNFDEDDFQDETWCLYDRQYLDDELWLCFSKFKRGVKIFMISDSCHSGSVAKGITDDDAVNTTQPIKNVMRNAPRSVTYSTYMAHRDIYLEFVKAPVVDKADVAATVMLFGACQDNEEAAEVDSYGLYTATFKKVFEDCKDIGCYEQLFEKIKSAMPVVQHPNLFTYGEGAALFLKDKLFMNNESPAASPLVVQDSQPIQ